MPKKTLSLIHMTRAMHLLGTFEDEASQLEMVATYQAPVSTLVKSRKDSAAMDDLIAQAAELPAAEAAEILADFFEQLASYGKSLAACLPRVMTLQGLETQTPVSESSAS
jgi:hypothetical protein